MDPYQARLAQVVEAALGEDLGLIVEPHGAGRAEVDVLAIGAGKRGRGERGRFNLKPAGARPCMKKAFDVAGLGGREGRFNL